MFISYPDNRLLVQRCPVMWLPFAGKFELEKFPLDKTDRDGRLMYGYCVAYMLHKPIERALRVRARD